MYNDMRRYPISIIKQFILGIHHWPFLFNDSIHYKYSGYTVGDKMFFVDNITIKHLDIFWKDVTTHTNEKYLKFIKDFVNE